MQNPERWLGDILSSAITTANGILQDPLLNKSVARITTQLSRDKSSPRVLVLDIAVINAWTLPGNTILITRGLAMWAQTDDILAGILAHELGHVERHHAWRQLSQSILLKVVIDKVPTKDRSLRLILNGITILTALSLASLASLVIGALGFLRFYVADQAQRAKMAEAQKAEAEAQVAKDMKELGALRERFGAREQLDGDLGTDAVGIAEQDGEPGPAGGSCAPRISRHVCSPS
jgi:hypothetical protein